MDESRLVHGGQRATQFTADRPGFVRAEWPLRLESIFECFAFDVLHPEARPPAVRRSAVDGDDVGMVKLGQRPGLGQKLFSDARARCDLGPEQFERDEPIEAGVPCQEHFTERAFAKPVDNLQVAPGAFGLFKAVEPLRLLRQQSMNSCNIGDETQIRHGLAVVLDVGALLDRAASRRRRRQPQN